LLKELRSYPWEWGNLRLWRATLRNPHGALQNVRETSAVGDRARSEKQEILTARMPVREGGVVHTLYLGEFLQKKL